MSDVDLLVIVEKGAASFWPRLAQATRFVAGLAAKVGQALCSPVVVSSSLVAQDLMPFVAADAERWDHLTLHVLLYPSPRHFVCWEPTEIQGGLLASLKVEPANTIVGSYAELRGDVHAEEEWLGGAVPSGGVRGADVAVQALLAGMVQAFCYPLYESSFVCRYAFHLFRYACRYLLRAEVRSSFLERPLSTGALGPPISASDARSAFDLIRSWLDAWRTRQDVPLASQLPSIYEAATLYFQDLFQYEGQQEQRPAGPVVLQKRARWTPESRRAISGIASRTEGPVYLVFRDTVLRNCRQASESLQQALGKPVTLWFSVKTFPSAGLIRILRSDGVEGRFSIACYRELELARRSGVPDSHLILHAPAMDAPLQNAVRAREIGTISVGSPSQYEILIRLSENRPTLLGRIRLPPETDSRFGMSVAELREVCRAGVHVLDGFHVHLGEHLYSRKYVSWVGEQLGTLLGEARMYHGALDLNLGGGWRSRLQEDWQGCDGLTRIRELWDIVLATSKVDPAAVNLHVELGRRLVGDAVVAIAHVVESKLGDAGWMHFLDLGTAMLPLLKTSVYGVSVLSRKDGKRRQRGRLVGPGCYERDRFGGAEVIAGEGDLVVFSNAGAYTAALASGFGGAFPRIICCCAPVSLDGITEEWHLE